MLKINIHEAKTHLSALVEKAAIGESFVIAKAGKPMVMVVPYSTAQKKKQRVGFLKGHIEIPDDFDLLGKTEIIGIFEGKD